MIKTIEIIILIAVLSLSIDLIISGIYGLKKKVIYPQTLLFQVLCFPMGILGSIVTKLVKKADNEIESEKAVIPTSIAAIGIGLFIMTFYLFYFVEEIMLVPLEIFQVIIPAVIIMVIISVSFAVVFSIQKYHNNKKGL